MWKDLLGKETEDDFQTKQTWFSCLAMLNSSVTYIIDFLELNVSNFQDIYVGYILQ